MSKSKIEICVGTTCHVMGAHALSEIYDELSEDIKDKFDCKYSLCFGDCHEKAKPPLIKVNGELVQNVTPDMFREIIEKIVKE